MFGQTTNHDRCLSSKNESNLPKQYEKLSFDLNPSSMSQIMIPMQYKADKLEVTDLREVGNSPISRLLRFFV